MSMIYLCTTKLNNSKLGDSQAITLMGTDVERICNTLQAFHECWISTIEIGVAVYLLERQVGVTCVVPTVVSLGLFMISSLTHHKLHADRRRETYSLYIGDNACIQAHRSRTEAMGRSSATANDDNHKDAGEHEVHQNAWADWDF